VIGLFQRALSENIAWLTPFFLVWKTKFGLKIQPNAWENYRIHYHKTNKEASTVLCSVVKHLGASAHNYRPNNGTSRKIDFAHFLPIDWL